MAEYSKVNLVSYLLLCLFVISFLVFLNSTQPFVLTDILGDRGKIGDKVGSLAFADEIVSILLCPLWGSLSDKIGTRPVALIGLFIVSLSLISYTTGKAVYPDLLLLRIFFAVGTSACVSMIPAILAEVSSSYVGGKLDGYGRSDSNADSNWAEDETLPNRENLGDIHEEEDDNDEDYTHFDDPAVVSENSPFFVNSSKPYRNSRLAGVVGMVTGIGAVLAVSLFLPLPTWLDRTADHSEAKLSLQKAYYIVGGVALVITILLFFGLHKDKRKSLRAWLNEGSASLFEEATLNSADYSVSYLQTIKMGFWAAKDRQIALSYIGGFVARSATVALTLFVPLAVNIWFYEQGICKVGDIHDSFPNDVKKGCHPAYTLAAILTGIANSVSLIFAPVWGFLGDRIGQHAALIISAVIGLIGCLGFAFVDAPNSPMSFVMACLLGAGQIGAIVISMSMCTNTRRQYNGAIAGVYSLSGGIGILLITKLGGFMSDIWKGTPFTILASFYFILCVATVWAWPKRFTEVRT